jgi:hypothetical protein
MKSLEQLQKEFGARIVTLVSGAAGLRGGVKCLVKDVDGNAPVMDFIASDETVDRYNEVIKQDGWELDNFMANPVVPDCHQYGTVGNILGRDILPKNEQVQNGVLCTRIEFAIDNPMGLLAYKLARGGFLKSMSVGFIPLEWTTGNQAGQPDRTYTRCELLEKSLVVVPANPGATIGNQIKSVLNVSERRDLATFLKEICSDEKTDPAPKVSASGAGVHDAQLLQFALGLKRLL